MKILEQLEAGLSQRQVASCYNISKSTVSNIHKRRADIEQMWEEGHDTNKRIGFRRTSNEAINQQVLLFYQKCRQANVLVTGPILKMKALDTAKMLGGADFRASNGWLDSFIKRYNIQLKGSRDKTSQPITRRNTTIDALNIRPAKTKEADTFANDDESSETSDDGDETSDDDFESDDNISTAEALELTQQLLSYGHQTLPQIVPMVLQLARAIEAHRNQQR